MTTTTAGRGTCSVCGDELTLTAKGEIRVHGPKAKRCEGGARPPKESGGIKLPAVGETSSWMDFREAEREHALAELGEIPGHGTVEWAIGVLERGEADSYGRPALVLMAGTRDDVPLKARAMVDTVRRAWASTGHGFWGESGEIPADPATGPNPHRFPLTMDQQRDGTTGTPRPDTPEEAERRAKLVANGNSPDMVGELMGDRKRETVPAFPPLTAADMVGAAQQNNPQFRQARESAASGPTSYAAAPQPTVADSTAPGTYVAHLRPGPEDGVDFDQWGRYKIWDAQAGKSVGRQRVTTFAKTISDQFGLGEWQQRKLLAGVLAFPHLAEAARGMIGTGSPDLDVKTHAKALNGVVDVIKTAAGDKVRADLGTAVHRITELYDLGRLTSEAEVPQEMRADLLAYARAMDNAGLKALPDFVERTTMHRGLDVAGTLDRILQLPNGDYVIGDVKTGANLDYAWLDIGIQLTSYAHGVNENGVWEWDRSVPERGRWLPAPKVRTDFAVVMHMPAGTGTCTLYRVDLERGWANASLAVQVRDARKIRTHATVLDLGAQEFQPIGMHTAVAGQPLPEVPQSAYAPDAVPLRCDHSFSWVDDGKGHSASVCLRCGELEETAPPMAPLQVQPHTTPFAAGAAPAPDPMDEARGQACDAMSRVRSQPEANAIWQQAEGYFPPGDAVFEHLSRIGTEALSRQGQYLPHA